VLFLSGEADQFSPVPDLQRLARRLPRGEVVILPDTDHFLWRREREAAKVIGDFFERTALDTTG
jgi:pimeloyl-ACP methyl ester carboxylesterase